MMTIGSNGLASVTATAAGDVGTYAIVLNTRGAPGAAAFTLTNQAEITARGLAVAAPGSTWFALPVAAFQIEHLAPGSAGPPASSFRAWINWGDGTWSAGTIKLAPDGSYQVVGSHRYKKAGTYRTTAQLLAWPPGLVLAQVQGKILAGGKAPARPVTPALRVTPGRRR